MTTPIEENGEFAYDYDLIDRHGVRVPTADIASIVMTLYNQETGAIINSRDRVDVFNANGGTYDSTVTGTTRPGTVEFVPEDNPIINDALSVETHVALFEAEWIDHGRRSWEVYIQVKNLRLATA